MLLLCVINPAKTENWCAIGLGFIIVAASIFVSQQVDDFVQIIDLFDEIFASRFLASADFGP